MPQNCHKYFDEKIYSYLFVGNMGPANLEIEFCVFTSDFSVYVIELLALCSYD
ncbi:hypothetical protein Enr17x_42660 [Gimesia fumaroli]|uniref:Uncharacterized protein n=1 Tax=Gimesia fumaroli TaxID=2527976 RepID=A0A518IGJ6_9PLAN|nr:hypothetical protein Enr17x_42660 [Gimesia fumaroli]